MSTQVKIQIERAAAKLKQKLYVAGFTDPQAISPGQFFLFVVDNVAVCALIKWMNQGMRCTNMNCLDINQIKPVSEGEFTTWLGMLIWFLFDRKGKALSFEVLESYIAWKRLGQTSHLLTVSRFDELLAYLRGSEPIMGEPPQHRHASVAENAARFRELDSYFFASSREVLGEGFVRLHDEKRVLFSSEADIDSFSSGDIHITFEAKATVEKIVEALGTSFRLWRLFQVVVLDESFRWKGIQKYEESCREVGSLSTFGSALALDLIQLGYKSLNPHGADAVDMLPPTNNLVSRPLGDDEIDRLQQKVPRRRILNAANTMDLRKLRLSSNLHRDIPLAQGKKKRCVMCGEPTAQTCDICTVALHKQLRNSTSQRVTCWAQWHHDINLKRTELLPKDGKKRVCGFAINPEGRFPFNKRVQSEPPAGA